MKWKRFGSNQDVLQPKQIKQIYTSIRQGVAKHKFLDALFVVVLKIPPLLENVSNSLQHTIAVSFCDLSMQILANKTAENYLLVIL